MEQPPPVPPKDQGYTSPMEAERPSTAHTSGSKRKRASGNDTPRRDAESDVDLSEYDDATPNKRPRTQPHQSDVSASEDNYSKNTRSVRRKKGSRNLSNLNLRHAARAQTPSQATIRGSRFQEGSLTDKPSDKPPSFFTRFSRTDIENVEHVDTLMSEYHDAALTPPHSVERASVAEPPSRLRHDPSAPKKEEARGFFEFGRQFVANLHPVALWRSVWNEAKEELTREMMEENERKAKLKAEAESKYAEMKRTGKYSLQLPDSTITSRQLLSDDVLTPRDSAIAFDSVQSSSVDHSRNTSAATILRSVPSSADHSTSEVPESTSKLSRGFKDRLHLKRPSFSNLKSDLKRMRSDLSLGGTRESSSSISPVKTDFDSSTLRKAASRADLKKQQKLSKRVSDLESKLQLAREELHEALIEASPMPKLAGKYEKFTPSGTIKRPRFMPGKLPSLPSERILMAQEQGELNIESETQQRNGIDLTMKRFQTNESQDDEDEETIKASRARAYPPRATSLFNLNPLNSNIENITPPEHKQERVNAPYSDQQHSSEAEDNMDPNSINAATGMTPGQAPKTGDYATLDAKLKALDANIKVARKANHSTKKRKTGEKDTAFKPPGADSDDDDEWAEATPKKKRKSAGKTESSPPSKRGTRGGATKSSPSNKKTKTSSANTGGVKNTLSVSGTAKEAEAEQQEKSKIQTAEDFGTDELTAEQELDHSVLDPVLEEEDEATAGAEDVHEPAKSTSQDTTTHQIRSSRSASPIKRTDSAAGEQIAHLTTQKLTSSRQASRSISPPPHAAYAKTTTVVDEPITVVPGVNGVPMLPTVTKGNEVVKDPVKLAPAEANKSKGEEFEWPEDVF